MPQSQFKSSADAFEREVTTVMRDFKVPGMAFLVVKNGEIFYERTFGYRKLTERKPVTSDTLFGIASMTKSLTCLAVLQLYQDGKLDIHAPVSDYLPITWNYKEEPIKLHHLMSHSSGMPCLNSYEFIMVNQGWNAKIPTFPLGNWEDLYSHINEASDQLIYPPNTKYFYWNGGFTLLGQIIEKITGISYEDYMKKNILDKLGMQRSTFSREELEKDTDASSGYNYKLLGTDFDRTPNRHLSSPFVSAAGGLNSSTSELSNYLQMHLNEGFFQETQLIDQQLLKEMYKTHNTHNPRNRTEFHGYSDDTRSFYGYGLMIYQNYHGHTLITHPGMSGFSGGNLGIIPELNISIVQLYNVHWIPEFLFHSLVVRLLGMNPEEVMPYFRRKKHFARLGGIYEAYKGTTRIKIENRLGMLHLIDDNWADQYVFPLIPKIQSDPEIKEFYIIEPSGTMDVLFSESPNGNIICDYERRILYKIE
jgi:CubicO group peptidase (beta-lactamase class C family)